MTLLPSDTPPRRCAIPLLVELCAGTAALSLRLEREKARPPVSRMGAKTGYADIILALAGLKPGDKAEHYLWCEPDDGVRLLLHAYRDADLAREAAAIIRSWADEDPRALWERLRAEGPAVCPPVEAREVGRFCLTTGWCIAGGGLYVGEGTTGNPAVSRKGMASRLFGGLPATIHDDARTLLPKEVARVALLGQWSFRRGEPDSGFNAGLLRDRDPTPTGGNGAKARTCEQEAGLWSGLPETPAGIHKDARTLLPREVARWLFVVGNKGPAADRFMPAPKGISSECNASPRGIARVLVGDDSMRDRWGCPALADSPLPSAIADDARTLLPREVARWLASAAMSMRGEPSAGFAVGDGCNTLWAGGCPQESIARRIESSQTQPSTIANDARTLDPPVPLPKSTLVYIDPPYLNTTGYADAFPREEWLPVLRRWADAGARCMVSEAEPIPDLVADGWHAVEITAMRVGQKRTFSKQQAEWVTMNFEPDARAARTCERALDRARRREQVTQAEQRTLFDP